MAIQGRVAEKVALVAGAASGIGRATAQMLAAQGALVCCADRDSEGAGRTAESIAERSGSATSCGLDVTIEEDWEKAFQQILASHGRIDILVNSAGISVASPVIETLLEDWRRVFAINLDGVFLGTKHGLRTMRAKGGSIVNVSSASGLKAAAGASAYSASKAAVCMLSRTAAKECREQGWPVRVNTVCPAGVKTPLWSSMPFFQELVRQTGSEDAAYRSLAGSVPGGRFAEPEEVALAILYLASDESRYVTGTDMLIDGGYII
jgi:3(or 17)beta-hydroxysteroid dehydrogenase